MEKLSLKDREWKEFVFEDIFNFEKGTKESLSKEVYENGYFDYVGATSRNNGTVGFVNEKYKKYIKKGNTVVFINTGEGSVGDAVYKTNDFIPSNNVTLGRADFLNKYVGLFITTIVNNQSFKYNYGYIRNENRLKRDKFLLPVNFKGEPDYVFMENYMKQKETELVKQYKKQVSDFESVIPLSEKEWKEFKIGNIFSVSTGSLIPKEILKKGTIARLTATDNNNGVFDFYEKVEHKNYREVTNFISVSFLGSVFYHSYTASLDMKIHAVQILNTVLNRYLAEFLVFCFKKMASIYSYGNQLSSTDLPKKKILLPITDKGNPDYAYMENYMKALENEKIIQYLKYKNRKHTTDLK